jgi:hypothetical protein
VQTELSVEWEASSKANAHIGFLDLPKEIRDMIYQEICAWLNRKGVRWEATRPHRNGTMEINKEKHESERVCGCGPHACVISNHYDAWKSTACPKYSTDCAIMRTCHQVHAEFASVLYGSPLELYGIARGNNVIPISPLYAGFVRAVFSTGAPGLNKDEDLDAWRTQLQIAAGLSRVFVNANTLRLGWFVSKEPDINSGMLPQRNPEEWRLVVKDVVKAVRTVKKISYTPLIVPHNLEVVQMYWTNGWRREVQSIPTPITEAIDMLRAKKPVRNARKTKR